MMNKIKPVEIVTISKIIPIYKDGQEANSICVVNFKFESGDECGYNVISQKGLYSLNDLAVYVQPDYCLSDISLFESFIRPFGDERKSKLGKNFRIRAVKFNFNFENSSDPIYSYGILMPKTEIDKFISVPYVENDLSEILGITKYEEPEKSGSGMAKGTIPSFLYVTDEINCANLKSRINRVLSSGQEVGLSLKMDGSSWTMYCKKDINGEWIHGICSRTMEKQLEQYYASRYVSPSGDEYHKYINPETKVKGWYCDALSQFLTDDQVKELNFKPIMTEVRDSWVDLAFSSGLFPAAVDYCKKHDVELAFRGEISGEGLKGSGNKHNPDAKTKQKLVLFGIDDLSSGFSTRINYSQQHNLEAVGEALGVQYTKVDRAHFNSYDDLVDHCENLFKIEKSNGRIIEGIVVRTTMTNDLSVKILNSEYDAVK